MNFSKTLTRFGFLLPVFYSKNECDMCFYAFFFMWIIGFLIKKMKFIKFK